MGRRAERHDFEAFDTTLAEDPGKLQGRFDRLGGRTLRILAFQHLAVEHPGVLADFWRHAGHDLVTVELDASDAIPTLEPFDLMVVLGGPMDVWEEERFPWLVAEKAAIRHWVRGLGRPFLGICLGHQLLADALGGKVEPMNRPEVGLAPVTLTPDGTSDLVLAGAGSPFQALHWHGCEVSRLPEGAVALASSAACPIQALRWGRRAYGIQCHIEITAVMADQWAAIPAYRASLEAILGADGPSRLAADVAAQAGLLMKNARRISDAILALVAMPLDLT